LRQVRVALALFRGHRGREFRDADAVRRVQERFRDLAIASADAPDQREPGDSAADSIRPRTGGMRNVSK